MPYRPDLKPGTVFGKLTVIKKSWQLSSTIGSRYLCECVCGVVRIIPRVYLVSHKYKSCGCGRNLNMQKDPGISSKRRLFNICKSNARIRDIPFNISFDEHSELIVKNCFYCNEPAKPYNAYLKSNGSKRKHLKNMKLKTIQRAWINANSIDRINNNYGYSIKNCVPSCWACNKMKVDTEIKSFLNQVNKIASFRGKNL